MNKWPTEERIDMIGANGGDGVHHELIRLNSIEAFHEQMLADVREERREYINKNNLNDKAVKL